MRTIIIILSVFLFSCTTERKIISQKTVTLDASPSYVSGGRGTGKIVKWEWQLNGKKIGTTPVISVMVSKGNYQYQLKATDNLGNQDSAILKVNVN